MTEEFFNSIVQEQLEECEQILTVKAKEYRRNNNPFHNFEEGAKMTGWSREKVLFSFLLKHLISLQDIRNDVEIDILPTAKILDEKYTDVINYLLLEKAMIIDKLIKKEE